MPKQARHIKDPTLLAALDRALQNGALSLPDACRSMRAREGLTQAEFAARVGVAIKVIKELESGTGNPTLDSLNRIAAFLGMQVGFVVRPQTVVELGSVDEYVLKRARVRQAELRAVKQGKSSLKRQHARNALRGADFTIELPELT